MRTNSLYYQYIGQTLSRWTELQPYLTDSLILSTGRDPDVVWDFMVIISDQLFEEKFKASFGDCFVISDHEHVPAVFVRFKSYEWLRNDLKRRLPIALWLFEKALIIHGSGSLFLGILEEYKTLFDRSITSIASQKYIEFRSERHNLRRVLCLDDLVAVSLIKATIVKLAFEIVLLCQRKPYPYKKWLSAEVSGSGEEGKRIFITCEGFLAETDTARTIYTSDILIASVVDILSKQLKLPDDLLQNWWKHLL